MKITIIAPRPKEKRDGQRNSAAFDRFRATVPYVHSKPTSTEPKDAANRAQ